MPANAPLSLAQLVAQAARQLDAAQLSYGHGTTNAWDEAAWLVLWRLGLPLDTDLDGPTGNTPIAAPQQAAALALIERRIAERTPAAYLTQEAWLHGLPFYIDERAIIPRSLIAAPLLDGHFDAWLPAPAPEHTAENAPRVLDLCTGNGSLAIIAALAWPDARIDALDISADALAVAAINCRKHGVQERVRLIQSDGLQALDPARDRYHLILCNPPYVNSQSMAALPPEYRAEPNLALAGGPDGMDFIRTLLHALPPYMQPHAPLVLEIGHERPHFERAFPQLNPLWLETDAGNDQVLALTREDLQQLPPLQQAAR